MRRKRKTIDDVTREEWSRLAEASIDLLSCCRFLNWLRGGCEPDDPSVSNTMDEMAAALTAIGLPQGTTEGFEKRLEDVLAGKIPLRIPKQ